MTPQGIPIDFFEDEVEQEPTAGALVLRTQISPVKPFRFKDDPDVRETTRTIKATIPIADKKVEILNQDPNIALLIDECHRSQAGDFHAYMMAALPNAAKIGFTGTPIFREGDKNTLGLFGRFIDKYGMSAALRDNAIVEIFYEGRSADGLVEQAAKLEEAFNNRFKNYTSEERALIRKRYGNEPDVLEAPELIKAKARDIMLHYATEIMPNGFKAQVVAVSRKAAVRYHEKLSEAKTEVLAEIDSLPVEKLALSEEQLEGEKEYIKLLVRAARNRECLDKLEMAVIMSADHLDPLSWKQWTDEAQREKHERLFKLPFVHKDQNKCSPLGLIIVKNMLLTGFDAPAEQALYLDRWMADHELLQAITRVNRKKSGKRRGYVVDYAAIAEELAAALKAMRAMEEGTGPTGGGVTSVVEALPRLREAHKRVMLIFESNGIESLLPIDPPVQLLADAALRADFINKLRHFLDCLGAIFTRPESAEFKRDAKILAFIARVASNVYQDPQLLLLGVEAKVRQLVDQYIAAQGIDPVVPPMSITDPRFAEELKKYGSKRTRAAAMQHAIRLQLATKIDEDPTLYKTFAEKLEAVLQQLRDRWEEQIAAMAALLVEIQQSEQTVRVEGIDPTIHGPFFGLIREEREQAGDPSLDSDPTQLQAVVGITREIVDEIRTEIKKVDFWEDANSRRQLENWLYTRVRQSRIVPRERAETLATKLLDLAYHRRRMLAA
jgi:type I restriction enzyme R subunit